jgi:WD40 repeat protein
VVLDAHAREIHVVAFSPDGSLFASAGGGNNPAADEITLWTTATGERRMTFADYKGIASSLAFSPDGKLLAAGAIDGRISILEVESGAERSSFTGTPGEVSSLAFTFDGKVLVSVVHAALEQEVIEVCRWDVDRSAQRAAFRPAASSPFALSSDGMTLAWIVPGRPSSLWTTNLETQENRLISNAGVVRGDTLVFSPDGKRLAAVHHESWSPIPNKCPYVYLVDVPTGRLLLRSPRPFDARRGLAISHDNKLLARGVDAGIQLWDLKEMAVMTEVGGPAGKMEGADLLVFSPDDKTLISSDRRGHLLLWDVPRLVASSVSAAAAP